FFTLFSNYIESQITDNLEVFCIGFNFPDFEFYGNGQPVNPHTWVFEKDVHFEKCNFGKFYLQSVEFNSHVYFDKAVFHGNLELNYCEFRGNISLERVIWFGECFLKIAFSETAVFDKCEFHKLTKFQINSKINLYKELTFERCIFHDIVSFYDTRFKGKNLFNVCTFHGMVDFNGAYFFNQTIDYDKTTTDFLNCIFNGEVEFVNSNFPTSFEKVLAIHKTPKGIPKNFGFYRDERMEMLRTFFNNRFDANYKEGHSAEVTPWKLKVCSSVIKFNIFDRFKHKILGINRFRKKFQVKGKNFALVFIMKNELDQDLTVNNQKLIARIIYAERHFESESEIPIKFDYSTFKERVRMVGTVERPLSLSGTSFKGVNLSVFEFHNVEWIRRRSLLKHRYFLIDELFLRKLENFGEVSNIYNQLRKNFETKLLFNESSDFFIGEMECIRKSLWKKNNSIYRLTAMPYFLYKIFALYGESVKLPLLWSLGIILLIAFIDYIFFNNPIFSNALKQSTFNFLPLSWTLPANATNGDLYQVEKLSSLVVFGSLFIALRRFERKK
ncbi:MAG: hypothetical protein L0H55_11095, partial [Candidatus Nitrosocosmicus sp.]|nr:hypothetical protein [Candidatus Nitrosocosmicus sp.]